MDYVMDRQRLDLCHAGLRIRTDAADHVNDRYAKRTVRHADGYRG